MKIISWNFHGLGNDAVVWGLLDLEKREDPDILFLAETKIDNRRIEKFRWMLGLPNMLSKPCVGKSGGIALFWRKGLDVTPQAILKYDIVVVNSEKGSWRFTGLYGEPHSDKKDTTWRALRVLNVRPGPWLRMGNFNEILYQHEKQGGAARAQRCMDKFRDVLEECGLDNLGYTGDIFTWRNHRHKAEGYIRDRLDRTVANMEWRDLFPGYEVINGEQRHSDHRPVILVLDGKNNVIAWGPNTNVFKFEVRWIQ
jgi:exonuclease III